MSSNIDATQAKRMDVFFMMIKVYKIGKTNKNSFFYNNKVEFCRLF